MTRDLQPDTYARNTLERYTGSRVEDFCSHILLCNFQRYIESFAELTRSEIHSGYWSVVHDRERDISIINFGVGSPSAGIIVHCLSFLEQLESVIMLGMCGGIDEKLQVGDILIPTASVRDEGTSIHYIPKNVPAQPSFWINRICEEVITKEMKKPPLSGIMLTTDYRMWEFDREFIDYILEHRILAIDMEIATLFAVAYALNVPIGAIMLISDLPLVKGGIKSKESAREVFHTYTVTHLQLGIKAMEQVKLSHVEKKKRLRSEW